VLLHSRCSSFTFMLWCLFFLLQLIVMIFFLSYNYSSYSYSYTYSVALRGVGSEEVGSAELSSVRCRVELDSHHSISISVELGAGLYFQLCEPLLLMSVDKK
jgi:hypothetical protein